MRRFDDVTLHAAPALAPERTDAQWLEQRWELGDASELADLLTAIDRLADDPTATGQIVLV